MPSDFITWVRARERSQEELITVERITEFALPIWRRKHKLMVEYSPGDAAQKERTNQRCNNPAYVPELLDVALERTAEVLGEMTDISFTDSYFSPDRVLRSISPLRWLPGLVQLKTSGSELQDVDALRELASLRVLHLSDKKMDDFSAVGACLGLRELCLYVHRPWPSLGSLASLTELEVFEFSGNLFALEDVAELPGVRSASLNGTGTALRDLFRLPRLPKAEKLTLGGVFGLAGIERYPRVRTLSISGPMEDLRPVEAMREVTFLKLQGDDFRDVSPLASLPELRWVQFEAQRPRDYAPLALAPKLHEVEVSGCPIQELELGALHMALEPWEAEWELAEPRPLPEPMGFYYYNRTAKLDPSARFWPLADSDGATWNGDRMMEVAERRWFQRVVTAEVARFFGSPESAPPPMGSRYSYEQREARVELNKYEEFERLPELLEVLRPLLARTKFRHAIFVSGRISVRDLRGEKYSWNCDEDEDSSERWREAEKKKREQMEREHRFELQKSDGVEIDPEDFAAPPLDEDRALVPAGGEIEKAAPQWTPREINEEVEEWDPDAWRFDEDLDDWSLVVHFGGTLTEEAYLVELYDAAQAQYYMRRKATIIR